MCEIELGGPFCDKIFELKHNRVEENGKNKVC